jgi:hypothetical protein
VQPTNKEDDLLGSAIACPSLRLRLTRCIAVLATSGAISIPASAAGLAVGHGFGTSPEAAGTAARADLALRLQRRAAAQMDGVSGKTAASVKQAIAGNRELPLIQVELASAGARGGEMRYEARLTEASLAAYEREARRLAERLRRLDPTGIAASEVPRSFSRLDQYRRVSAVLGLFSRTPQTEVGLDEAALRSSAVKNLAPVAGAKDVARRVKRELDRTNIAPPRVIAPARADTAEVTALSAAIAEELRTAVGAGGSEETATHTLDGRYAQIDGRLVLTLFLLDASFNTQRAFVFVLPSTPEQRSRELPASSGFPETLNRGLVRVESPGAASAVPSVIDVMDVNVRMGRGNRGLYYRPGERDTLHVKLDRPGYYYIVGHVQKEATRFSYLMEIGAAGTADRFVRRVARDQVHRWQTVGEFTVEAPAGLEAVQVFATSAPPQRMLPATRFDPVRNLHVIGADPVAAIKRTRGLVLVNVPDSHQEPGGKAKPVPLAVGEAVLQFSTLP